MWILIVLALGTGGGNLGANFQTQEFSNQEACQQVAARITSEAARYRTTAIVFCVPK
jgi:hypothetical protein